MIREELIRPALLHLTCVVFAIVLCAATVGLKPADAVTIPAVAALLLIVGSMLAHLYCLVVTFVFQYNTLTKEVLMSSLPFPLVLLALGLVNLVIALLVG